MKQRLNVILFTVVACSLAGAMLTGATSITKEAYEANRAYDKQFNIADVLAVEGFDKSAEEAKLKPFLAALFEEGTGSIVKVSNTKEFTDGKASYRVGKYTYYEYYKTAAKQELLAYAFPIGGGGFQGSIVGFLGVAADQKSIVGISFYDNVETPGLGGRISSPNKGDAWIREQFVKDADGNQKYIHFYKQEVDGINIPDFDMVNVSFVTPENVNRRTKAITGATQTSNSIGSFLPKNIIVFYAALASEGTLIENLQEKVK